MKISQFPKLSLRAKRSAFLSVSALLVAFLLVELGPVTHNTGKKIVEPCVEKTNHACVMKTIFGLDADQPAIAAWVASSPEVDASVKRGLNWIANAQGNDGGWGAGTHSRQDITDPHAVPSDPATTALVSMALLRTDNTLKAGDYSKNLALSTEFLLKVVENCPANQPYITLLVNTQPQVKLGRNIDVILTAQFFTNILRYPISEEIMKKRIEAALDKCVTRVQDSQGEDGSWKDGGWAPVLQSALANNALENAKDVGRKVDSIIMLRGTASLNSNYDIKTKSVITGKSAGVMLYSLSSTTRSSAKQARKARDIVEKARREGKIKDDKVTEENLREAGVSAPDAEVLVSAYSINQASNVEALRADVMEGFGSNGGEEFMSYLMTGESMLMQGGNEWKKWYDMMEAKLVKIQNTDGSWQGHHCITSPVFCTASCLLILSIHNDMQFSMKQINTNK